MTENFRALVVSENSDGSFSREISERQIDSLPAGDVLIRVKYSSLNYKDALSAFGNKGVTKKYPHTPGIDAAGTVAYSAVPAFKEGDEVIVTGYDLGMNTSGGFGEYISVPASWVIPVPRGLTMKESMALGTAGLTAALCVMSLLQAGTTNGNIAVTGATGGVGSIALSILKAEGFSPTAITGKTDADDFLLSAGADAVEPLSNLVKDFDRPLLKPIWDGGVDVLGGNALSAMIKSTKYGRSIACCGLAMSADLAINVFPFILRGVNLLGVDSVECPMDKRQKAWELLGGKWKPANINNVTEIGLDGLERKTSEMLAGKLKGRIIVAL
jgi:acrylyl-CoA reductase (NADPH)